MTGSTRMASDNRIARPAASSASAAIAAQARTSGINPMAAGMQARLSRHAANTPAKTPARPAATGEGVFRRAQLERLQAAHAEKWAGRQQLLQIAKRVGVREWTKVANKDGKKRRGTPEHKQAGGPSKSRKKQMAEARKKAARSRAAAATGGATAAQTSAVGPPPPKKLRPGQALAAKKQAAAAESSRQAAAAADGEALAAQASRRAAAAHVPATRSRSRGAPARYAEAKFVATRHGPMTAAWSQHINEAMLADLSQPNPVLAGKHIIGDQQFVDFVERIGHCQACLAGTTTLKFCRLVERSRCFVFRCSLCFELEQFETSPLEQISAPGEKMVRRRNMSEVAAGAMSGAGYAVYRKLLGMLELPCMAEKAYHRNSAELLHPAVKRAFMDTVIGKLDAIIQAARDDHGWDGNGLIPITYKVDTRWNKPFGWCSLDAMTNGVEGNTGTVICCRNSHKPQPTGVRGGAAGEAAGKGKHRKSSKQMDATESGHSLLEVCETFGFIVIEVVHDNDSTAWKTMYGQRLAMDDKHFRIGGTHGKTLCGDCGQSTCRQCGHASPPRRPKKCEDPDCTDKSCVFCHSVSETDMFLIETLCIRHSSVHAGKDVNNFAKKLGLKRNVLNGQKCRG